MADASDAIAGRPRRLLPLDLVRGFLIGMAELVPGVSGGTVALVTRVYDELIDSASHVVEAAKVLVAGPDRVAGVRRELRRTDWWLVVPVLVGMATAVLTVAGVMSGFVTDHPELSRGLFFGLVATSVVVPFRMLPAAHLPAWADALLVLGGVVVAFWLTSLAAGGTDLDPAWPVVFVAAAIAVCALVVPGVSGSFFLLAVGLYTTTMDAISERDLGYVAVFAAGAVVGLASFVRLLHHLLHRRRRTTLLVMAGLMIGSLRALWPWQGGGSHGPDDEAHGPGELLAPAGQVWEPVLLAVVGAVVVGVLVLVEARHGAADRAREEQAQA